MVWEQIVLVTIGGAIAAIFGGAVAYNLETAKNKKTIKKVQDLLNNDFTHIHELLSKHIPLTVETFEKLSNNEISFKNVIDREHPNHFSPMINPYHFSFWDAIIASGNLIKLEEKEIRNMTAAHGAITSYCDDIEELRESIYPLISKPDPLTTKQDQDSFLSILRNNLLARLYICHFLYKMEISWIKLEKIDEESISKAKQIVNWKENDSESKI